MCGDMMKKLTDDQLENVSGGYGFAEHETPLELSGLPLFLQQDTVNNDQILNNPFENGLDNAESDDESPW